MASSVSFCVRCDCTKPGERVYVVGGASALGTWSPATALPLATSAAEFPRWAGEAELPAGQSVEFKCVVRREDDAGAVRWEDFSGNRRVTPEAGKALQVSCAWGSPAVDVAATGGPGAAPGAAPAAADAAAGVPSGEASPIRAAATQCRGLRLKLPGHLRGQPVVCGDGPALGNWNPRSAPQLQRVGPEEWALPTAPPGAQRGAGFKFVVLDGDGQPRWEDSRGNRKWTGEVHSCVFDAPSPRPPRRAKEGAAELTVAWGSAELDESSQDFLQVPGAVFHAFHWSFGEVQRRAQEIAAAGFDAVQLSPAQRSIPGDQWWTRYQPVRYEEIHGLGSEHDLKNACEACKNAGLQVLGDLVFNHMQVVASCDEWRRAQHDHGHLEHLKRRLSQNLGPTFNRNDFQWPWLPLEGEEWDGPNRMEGWGCGEWSELKGGSEKVVAVHAAHIEKLKNCGVSGFRFDAAKHMRPEHIATYVSKAQVYAFGEVLSIDPGMQREYTEGARLKGGESLPTTDFLLAVWLRRFLEGGPEAVDFDFGKWVQHLLDVEFGRGGSQPQKVGLVESGKLEAPVLARNSVRFARNHDTVCNDVPFYGLGKWGQDGAQMAAAWLLAAHDGSVLLLADDVRASALIREALAYRKALRACLASLSSESRKAVRTVVRAQQAADGGPPLSICVACRTAGGGSAPGQLLGFCVLNPDARGATEFSASSCLLPGTAEPQVLRDPSAAARRAAVGSDGQLAEVLSLPPHGGAFFVAEVAAS